MDQMTCENKFRQHMKDHIDTLVASILAYSKNDYPSDIKNTDNYLNAGMDMAFDLQK
ncbi:MAG: hypothetical protein Edafosvirus2_53 [Edafosvirus sp.]|uniref:Uncharacterized protein n=1 Tax=Edafosvirus sp. TaxID=2487765 RepID=A0A3G4ZU79_9VIRU|nr:MAG: hypothetical protein Edafosvirus2_53 [Edafosvirus sp.]